VIDYWIAPWCVGYLSEKPILHEDIWTFYSADSTVVSPHQLLLVDEYGCIPPPDYFDFGFDLALDLDDPDNFESEDELSECVDVEDLKRYANVYGISYETDDMLAASRVIDMPEDEVFPPLENQFSPLLQTYVQRVTKVARIISTRLCEDFSHITFEKRDMLGLWSVLCQITNPLKQERWAYTHPIAKVMFTLFPVLMDIASHPDYLDGLVADFINVFMGNTVKTQYMVRMKWDYYAHYPLAVLNYLKGLFGAGELQNALRDEFRITGCRDGILIDEKMVIDGDYKNGLMIVYDYQSVFDYWVNTHPIVVDARITPGGQKQVFIDRYYPHLHYVKRDYFDHSTYVDLRLKSPHYVSMFVGPHTEAEGYVRTLDQAVSCLGFYLKAVLARGPITFAEDEGIKKKGGFSPVQGIGDGPAGVLQPVYSPPLVDIEGLDEIMSQNVSRIYGKRVNVITTNYVGESTGMLFLSNEDVDRIQERKKNVRVDPSQEKVDGSGRDFYSFSFKPILPEYGDNYNVVQREIKVGPLISELLTPWGADYGVDHVMGDC